MRGEEEKIAKLLISVGKKQGEEEAKNLFQLLVQLLKKKRKLYLLTKILKEVKKEEEKEQVEILLAREFDVQTKRKIKEEIERIFKGKEAKITIKEGIIGGFLAKSKDYLIDGSIKGMINRCLNNLTLSFDI